MAPNLLGNGVGYINHIDSEYHNVDSTSRSAEHFNTMARLSPTSDLLPAFNDLINMTDAISSIDFNSLNNSILDLTKNVETICKFAITADSLNDKALHFLHHQIRIFLNFLPLWLFYKAFV